MTELDFSNKNIKLIEENAFVNFSKNLKQLLIANNSLLNLPNHFGNLTQLTKLDVSFNSLQILNQANFNEFTSLKFLYLNNNRIKSLDANSFARLTNLIELYLNENLITQLIVDLFSPLSNLIYLNLSMNSLNSLDNKNTFKGLVSLKEINMNMCSLGNLNFELFKHLPLLQKVFLKNNNNNNELKKYEKDLKHMYMNVTFEF